MSNNAHRGIKREGWWVRDSVARCREKDTSSGSRHLLRIFVSYSSKQGVTYSSSLNPYSGKGLLFSMLQTSREVGKALVWFHDVRLKCVFLGSQEKQTVRFYFFFFGQ